MNGKEITTKEFTTKEFRERGYLQEVNRKVLHPLGLAMFVDVDEQTGQVGALGIYDHRDDPEGVYYAFPDDSPGAQHLARLANRMAEEWSTREQARTEALGYMVQPMGDA